MMHPSSYRLMGQLLEKWKRPTDTRVLDVGSQDVNGTYRRLPMLRRIAYTGIDIAHGRNVDRVIDERGGWRQALDTTWPLIISGQTIEHTRQPWRWIEELATLLDPEGLVILIAPWYWPYHRYPIDAWRILPDGMEGLLDHGGLDVLETGLNHEGDCWGVGLRRDSCR